MPSVSQSTPRQSSTAQSSSPPAPSGLSGVRATLQDLFTGRSTVGRPSRNQPPESPKTPRPVLQRPVIGLQNLPTTRINIPHLTRVASSDSARSHSSTSPLSPHAVDSPQSIHSIIPNSRRQQTETSGVIAQSHPVRHNSNRRFVGVDPAELHLAQLVQDGRRRRRAKTRNRSHGRNHTCAPKIKNKHIRSKILSCFVSGLVSNPQPSLYWIYTNNHTSSSRLF
jgi:hypothetical protein